jgi:hypothetical protein
MTPSRLTQDRSQGDILDRIDVEVELGPVRLSGGVSIDDDGNVGSAAVPGAGIGGGVKGTVNPSGKVRGGGEIEGGGCIGPGVAACFSASSGGGASAGVGVGDEAGITYRRTKRLATLW